MKRRVLVSVVMAVSMVAGCDEAVIDEEPIFQPKEVIDLGALVTEDLPDQVWGKALLTQFGLDRPNVFDVVLNEIDTGDGQAITGSNAFYTLANHGGPHVDAPNHLDLGPGIDGYRIETFSGPLKVFDVREYPLGRTITKDVFSEASIAPGDVVMVYTGYTPPQSDEDFPETTTLTRDAAEFLAEIPVRAFATDAFSVGSNEQRSVDSEDPVVRAIPIHHSFLSRGIPVYEQLFNVESTLRKERMYFVGVPLNIKDGDGMIVRPVVFVY